MGAPPRPSIGERRTRDGGRLYLSRARHLATVRAVLVNERSWNGILTHELLVERTGPSGRAQINLSGYVSVERGCVQTLTEKTVSVTGGDALFAALIVWEGRTPVDEVYLWREFEG